MKFLVAMLFCILAIGCSPAKMDQFAPVADYEKVFATVIPEFAIEEAPLSQALSLLNEKLEQENSGISVNYALADRADTARTFSLRLKNVSVFDILRVIAQLSDKGWRLDPGGVIVFFDYVEGSPMRTFAMEYSEDWLEIDVNPDGIQFQECSEGVEKILKEVNMKYLPYDFQGAFYVPSRKTLFVRTTFQSKWLLEALIEQKKEKSEESKQGVSR